MASSYDAQQKLNQLIANDTTPNMSTIDILSSLKLINHFEQKVADADDNPSTKIAKEELKYLSLGMKALDSNPALTSRFGSGFQGAMAISGLLKAKQSERVYNEIIDGILDSDPSTLLANVVANVNDRGGGGAIPP